MAEQQPQDQGGSLLEQVKRDIEKSDKESVKAKLKTLVTKRREHEKGIKLLDQEIGKLVEDFQAGLL